MKTKFLIIVGVVIAIGSLSAIVMIETYQGQLEWKEKVGGLKDASYDNHNESLQKILEDCKRDIGITEDGYSLWANQTHKITTGTCEIQKRTNSGIALDVTTYTPKPYTQSIITIQDRLPDRTIVPIMITQLTLNAESLGTITDYNFSILNITMRSLGDYWGNLPNQYITNEIVDEYGNDILNYDKLPTGFVVYPLSLETYPAVCRDEKQIKGESAYPTPIPIINGTSDVYFKKSSIGIYPNNNGKYFLEFVSGYETNVHHPYNVIIESHQTQKCILEKNKHGFDEVYYTTVVFSFK